MSIGDQARRIREAKRLKLEEVADKAQMTWQYLSRLERGERRFNEDTILSVSGALGCDPRDLLSDEGVTTLTVPIVGYVGAGEQVYNVEDPGAGLGRTEPPPGAEDTVAIIVRGESMYPRYEDGDLLFFRPTDHVRDDALGGRASVVQVKDGPTYVKRVFRGSREGLFRLASYRAPDINDVELQWATRVLWVKQP